MRGRDRSERGEERRATEDALGVVGVQPDPLPLAGRERALLLPDRAQGPRRGPRRGRAPHGAPPSPALPRTRTAVRLRSRGPRRPRSARQGMARRGRRSRPSPRARGRSPGPRASTRGAGSQARACSHTDGSSSIARISSTSSTNRAAITGSRALPARSPTTRAASSAPPSTRWTSMSRATWAIRIASGISSPLAPGAPFPSQRSSTCANSSPIEAGSPSLSISIRATSRQAMSTRGITRAALGTLRAISTTRTGSAAPGDTERAIAATISRGSPNHTGMRWFLTATAVSPRIAALTWMSAVQPTCCSRQA